MPGPVFVVVEAEFVLGRLNAVLDCPAVAFNLHERVDPSPGHAPSHEERQFAVHNMSSDQQAASAQPGASFTGIGGLNVCKFDIGPVVQSRTFRALTWRQAMLGGCIKILCNLTCSVENSEPHHQEPK